MTLLFLSLSVLQAAACACRIFSSEYISRREHSDKCFLPPCVKTPNLIACKLLFHRFSDRLRPQKKFRGYRLLAADGSSLKSGAYPADKDAYRPGTQRQHGWNLFHINALFDLENGIYTDVIAQKEHTKHESRALREMAVRSAITDPVILLADRNYEAYNNFACLEKRGWK